jgi:hypothetical protein
LSDNQWSIFLLVGADASVRINMEADRGYITGQLHTTNHQYALSNSALQHWDFVVNDGVVVRQFTNLIVTNKRHLYNMAQGGSGCRYWMYVMTKACPQPMSAK